MYKQTSLLQKFPGGLQWQQSGEPTSTSHALKYGIYLLESLILLRAGNMIGHIQDNYLEKRAKIQQ